MAITRIKGPCGWGVQIPLIEIRLGRVGFAIGDVDLTRWAAQWRATLIAAREVLALRR